MKIKKDTWIALGGLTIIIGAFYLVWYLVGVVFSAVLQLDEKTRTTVVTVSGTLVSAVLTLVLGQYYTRAKERRDAQRPKKIEIYTKVISATVDFMHQHFLERSAPTATASPRLPRLETGELDTPRARLESDLRALLPDLILWASPTVLASCHKLGSTQYFNASDVLADVETVYRAMRDDIGLSNSGLEQVELLKVAFLRG
jgi:membrane protein implicated in regulation of membrane protease activity